MIASKINKVFKDVVVLSVLVLGGVGVFHIIECGEGGYSIIGSETVSDTVYVSISDTIEVYRPKIVKEHISLNDTIYVGGDTTIIRPQLFTREDTLNVINTYFSKRTYVDSLETEYGYVIVEDELWKNEIYSRKYHYNFLIPEVTNTTTNTVSEKISRFNLFAGLNGNIALGSEDYDVYDNELLLPKGYIGAHYRFGESHYVNAEVDVFRRDIRLGYSFLSRNFAFNSQYSIEFNTINCGLRYYILK